MASKREAELLQALCGLWDVVWKTAKLLEEECPSLAEVGYWSRSDKEAYERARHIVRAARRQEPSPGFYATRACEDGGQ